MKLKIPTEITKEVGIMDTKRARRSTIEIKHLKNVQRVCHVRLHFILLDDCVRDRTRMLVNSSRVRHI